MTGGAEPRHGVYQLVRSDIEAATAAEDRGLTGLRLLLVAIYKLLVGANVRAVLMYRVAHSLAQRGLLPLALLLRAWGVRSSGAEINPLAEIGPGLYVAHAVGVGVAANVRIGSNCRLHLGSVIGVQPHGIDEARPTVLGDDVFVGTHAVVLGGVTVGDGATIGANAVVVRDVPPYAVVAAPPGRVVAERAPGDARP